MAEKKLRARSRAAPKTSLAKVIERHNEITLLIALYEAVLETCEENFVYRDGLEPKSIIVTNDGRRVPEDMISDVITIIRTTLLNPLEKELNQLNKRRSDMTETTATTPTEPTIQDAVAELQKVVSHNAQVTMHQYENAINGVRLNNLLLNAIIRKVGLSAEAVKEECDKIREEIEAQAKENEEAQAQEEQASTPATLSMTGDGGEHPEGAIVFGD